MSGSQGGVDVSGPCTGQWPIPLLSHEVIASSAVNGIAMTLCFNGEQKVKCVLVKRYRKRSEVKNEIVQLTLPGII